MRITGNKGEWSELYAFLKLLSIGKLYAADENVERIDEIFFPVKRIIRPKESCGELDYVINTPSGDVDILLENSRMRTVSKGWIDRAATYLYSEICSGSNRAFEIAEAERLFKELNVDRIAAPSTDKTDITIQIHDIQTGYDPVCGFSIKSELGNSPTLLNASKATNFSYSVDGISDEEMIKINAISSTTKILDRINAITEKGEMKFNKANNNTFSENLMLIDTSMEAIIGELLLDYYTCNEKQCKKLIDRVEAKNPLHYPRKGFYEYKFKKFLCSVALGMTPSTAWNGVDEANGGYVIVKQNGDVLAYHIYNRNAFETYLLNNTKFERASTSRHDYASVYKDETGKKYINLNLQIRFI